MLSTRWREMSVRRRLTVAIAALVAAAILAAGLTVWIVETRRIDRGIDRSMTQSFETFRTDSDTGTGIDIEDALYAYLLRSMPDDGEIVWMFPPSGGPRYVGRQDPHLLDTPRFSALVESLRTRGGRRDFASGGDQYRVGVLPVHRGDERGALVITRNRSQAREPLVDLLVTYAVIGLLSLVIVLAASWWLAGRLLRPLTHLRETARDIGAGSLGERLVVTGHDDLSDLQITFNDMLDRLESAFAAQRTMLDDAGHELRTPLTVVRGHLEVMDLDDPDDLAETRDLLLDEIDRMSRLVGDLLVLAKARRPDFVQRSPVALDALGEGVLSRCSALADRVWRSELNARGTALLDSQRITQALLQLADNAVRHTEPGDTITVGSHSSPGDVEFWVADTGRGVDPEARETIFARFTSTGQHDGAGLGLSIVRAIVEAHGGTVGLDDTPRDYGAVFRIRLPLGWIR